MPLLMNGVDISWSVIEGDFGLDRPIGMKPTVVYRPLPISAPAYVPPGPSGPGYFPRTGRKPGYGRLEVVPPPNRPLPPPAPSYYRSWSSESAPGPVTDYTPYNVPAWVNVYAGAGSGGNGAGGTQAAPQVQTMAANSFIGWTASRPAVIRLVIEAILEGSIMSFHRATLTPAPVVWGTGCGCSCGGCGGGVV